jgi:hypothetical protein
LKADGGGTAHASRCTLMRKRMIVGLRIPKAAVLRNHRFLLALCGGCVWEKPREATMLKVAASATIARRVRMIEVSLPLCRPDNAESNALVRPAPIVSPPLAMLGERSATKSDGRAQSMARHGRPRLARRPTIATRR